MVRRSLSPELLERCREFRQSPTKAEELLWECLRNKRLNGYKFRRQHPAGGYILDFYCPVAKLEIELDGSIHQIEERFVYDRKREEDLARLGVKTIRFWNNEVTSNIERVLETILEYVEEGSKK